MSVRKFHYKDEKSDKFWSIRLNGKEYTTEYGRRGSKPRSDTNTYESEDEARQEYEELIEKKLGKGYVEVTSVDRDVISELEKMLRKEYEPGYGHLFVERIKTDEKTQAEFRADVPYELPDLFFRFHTWAKSVDFPAHDVSDKTSFGDANFGWIHPLSTVARGTKMWEQLKEKDPTREWVKGFVEIESDDATMIVIDTQGSVFKPGAVLTWDFKGGSSYELLATSFKSYLELIVGYLREGLLFPPSLTDNEAYEKFMWGNENEKVRADLKVIARATQDVQFKPFNETKEDGAENDKVGGDDTDMDGFLDQLKNVEKMNSKLATRIEELEVVHGAQFIESLVDLVLTKELKQVVAEDVIYSVVALYINKDEIDSAEKLLEKVEATFPDSDFWKIVRQDAGLG